MLFFISIPDNHVMDYTQKGIKKVLSSNLKKYRAKLRITQEEAAERAGLSLNYWQRLEMVSQNDLPSLPTLGTIAKVLNCKLGNLLGS